MLIRTKLHPPRVAADTIVRSRLERRLDASSILALTLVSAPAGYGKSTLVVNWLRRREEAYAWLTLDEGDNDLSSFLTYIVAAVRSVAPEACRRAAKMLQRGSLPPIPAIAGHLANDLDELGDELILVLDDVQVIRNLEIHDLLLALLRHPPAPLHLILVARFDPPLPIDGLRGRGYLDEIREADLQFSTEEAKEYFERAGEGRLEARDAEQLCQVTEGWIVGMKLAALLVRQSGDPRTVLEQLKHGVENVRQYLLAESLSAQPPELQRRLLEASILERFSEPLWRAVSAQPYAEDTESPSAWTTQAIDAGLFMIPLDARDEWFRFHHLFRDALRTELERSLSSAQIAALHRRAALWLKEHGYAEEALHHYELAGDGPAAAALVRSQRTHLMATERWGQLDRWLRRLPDAAVSEDIELLLTRAWIEEDSYRYVDLLETLERIEVLSSARSRPGISDSLRGEIDTLICARHFLACDGRHLVRRASRALSMLPTGNLTARAFALALLAMGHQMVGDADTGIDVLEEALRDRQLDGTSFESLQLTALSMVHWMEGNIRDQLRTAGLLLRKAEQHGLAKSAGYGRCQVGIGLLENGDLADAEECLSPMLEQQLDTELGNTIFGTFALALIAQATGRPDRARTLAERASDKALQAGNADLIGTTSAFEAEISVRQGRVAQAALWAETFTPSIRRLRNRFYQPELTLVRVLLEDGTASEKLERLIDDLRDHLASIHARRHLIDLLALAAVFESRRGNDAAVLELLAEAVEAARPRGIRRPFHDLGEEMPELLGRLDLDDQGREFIASIPDFGAQKTAPVPIEAGGPSARNTLESLEALVEEFTQRELEVLTLLDRRFSNKEIAGHLGISPATVKRHNANLFDKLQVRGGRRQAVAKARSLGMLAHRSTI